MLKLANLSRLGIGPVDLDLADGECVVVSGPSGAGKSILLRAIADLDPSEGRVELDGSDKNSFPAPDWRRQVGYLAAESGWWEERVADHFADPESAKPLLPRINLPTEALNWLVRNLSTGERQRLAFIRLLLNTPKIMLLDEPTAALDPASRDAVEVLIRERMAEGVGVILVSHDAGQAARLGARSLRLEQGRLSAS